MKQTAVTRSDLTSTGVGVGGGCQVFYLLLKRAGDQPAQLAQTVVDSVTAPFLNDLANDATCYNMTTLRVRAFWFIC